MRVIIVEDETILRQGLVRTLPWAEMGCEIVGEAGNGLEGLETAGRQVFDVVLMDILLPGLNGLEALAQLRKRSATPVILIAL